MFEAAIESKGKLIRIDILQKTGLSVKLIEVKSKSYQSSDDPKTKQKNFKELEDYIIDVAYQYLVLNEAYPDFDVKSFLFLPDKSKNTKIEGLNLLFRIEAPKEPTGKFREYNVLFDEANLESVRSDDLMTLVDVHSRVLELQPSLRDEVKVLLKSLKDGIVKINQPLTKDCFKCEYAMTDEGHLTSGFDECFAGYPKPEHHIKDLYHLGTIGGNKNPFANELIRDKKMSITDMPLEILTGKRGERQLIQIKNTLDDTEWVSPDLSGMLRRWQYPLHFIDFETTITALPFHKGMRPYEAVAFQWSCHTIERKGAEPVHSEWINLSPEFPNFKFAEALMNQIGTTGTVLIWATHENTILGMILKQYEKYGYHNDELYHWLTSTVRINKEDEGRLTDMNKMTLDHYFHPRMKGKTSIKWTLPAVLNSCRSDRTRRWLKEFEPGLSLLETGASGAILNPYKRLPPVDIYEQAESVNDGTGAMRAYEDLMFGLSRGDTEKFNKYKQALLRYCKLDTLAMVIIWEHWTGLNRSKLIKDLMKKHENALKKLS